MRIFGLVYPARLLMGAVSLLLVCTVRSYKDADGGLPYWLYAFITLSMLSFVAVQVPCGWRREWPLDGHWMAPLRPSDGHNMTLHDIE